MNTLYCVDSMNSSLFVLVFFESKEMYIVDHQFHCIPNGHITLHAYIYIFNMYETEKTKLELGLAANDVIIYC